MPAIRKAEVTNDNLMRMIQSHRMNALKAVDLVQKPADAANFARVQDATADIYQELLDRRMVAQQ